MHDILYNRATMNSNNFNSFSKFGKIPILQDSVGLNCNFKISTIVFRNKFLICYRILSKLAKIKKVFFFFLNQIRSLSRRKFLLRKCLNVNWFGISIRRHERVNFRFRLRSNFFYNKSTVRLEIVNIKCSYRWLNLYTVNTKLFFMVFLNEY